MNSAAAIRQVNGTQVGMRSSSPEYFRTRDLVWRAYAETWDCGFNSRYFLDSARWLVYHIERHSVFWLWAKRSLGMIPHTPSNSPMVQVPGDASIIECHDLTLSLSSIHSFAFSFALASPRILTRSTFHRLTYSVTTSAIRSSFHHCFGLSCNSRWSSPTHRSAWMRATAQAACSSSCLAEPIPS